MKKLYPNIYLVNENAISDGTGSTFLITRRGGNVLFPTKFDISGELDAIKDKGPVSHLLIGDRHQVGPNSIKLAKSLKQPLTASDIEAKAVKKKGLTVANALPLTDHKLAPNLLALPTPGHTPGALSYLYTTPTRRYLFIGDTLVPSGGDWKYWVSKGNRELMCETLNRLISLEFDVLICNSFAATDGAAVEITKRSKNSRLRALIKSLRN